MASNPTQQAHPLKRHNMVSINSQHWNINHCQMLNHSKCIEQGFNSLYSGRGVHSHPRNFRGDTTKKERTPNVESPKSADLDKQDSLHKANWPCWIQIFCLCGKLEEIQNKTSGSNCQSNTHLYSGVTPTNSVFAIFRLSLIPDITCSKSSISYHFTKFSPFLYPQFSSVCADKSYFHFSDSRVLILTSRNKGIMYNCWRAILLQNQKPFCPGKHGLTFEKHQASKLRC